MTPNEIEKRCHELVEIGNAKFRTNVKISSITWFEKGQAAGWASWKRVDGVMEYSLRFSFAAYRTNKNDMINNTVPHEVAHLIVYALKEQGRSRDKGHGRDFKMVCRALGGSGERCHQMKLPKARTTEKFIYRLNSGRIVQLGATVHKKVQLNNKVRLMLDTKERFDKNDFTGQSIRS